jgi:hypothetical protein
MYLKKIFVIINQLFFLIRFLFYLNLILVLLGVQFFLEGSKLSQKFYNLKYILNIYHY